MPYAMEPQRFFGMVVPLNDYEPLRGGQRKKQRQGKRERAEARAEAGAGALVIFAPDEPDMDGARSHSDPGQAEHFVCTSCPRDAVDGVMFGSGGQVGFQPKAIASAPPPSRSLREILSMHLLPSGSATSSTPGYSQMVVVNRGRPHQAAAAPPQIGASCCSIRAPMQQMDFQEQPPAAPRYSQQEFARSSMHRRFELATPAPSSVVQVQWQELQLVGLCKPGVFVHRGL